MRSKTDAKFYIFLIPSKNGGQVGSMSDSVWPITRLLPMHILDFRYVAPFRIERLRGNSGKK